MKNIYTLLSEGHLEKLFFMTLNDASANNVFVYLLKGKQMLKNGLLSEADYCHILCCANILNLITQDSLTKIDDLVEKTRESIKYARGSQVSMKKFIECIIQVSLDNQQV